MRGRQVEADLPGACGLLHLRDDLEHRPRHQDRHRRPHRKPRGRDGEDRARSEHDETGVPHRTRGRARSADGTGHADLEGHHRKGVEDEKRGHQPARRVRPVHHPERNREAQQRHPQQQDRVERGDDGVRPVAQHGKAGLLLPARHGSRYRGQPEQHQRAEQEADRVQREDGQVGPARVVVQGEAAERGADGETGVECRLEVGQDPRTRRGCHQACEQRLPCRGEPALGDGVQTGREEERNEGADEEEGGDRRAGGQAEQNRGAARPLPVGERTERHTRDGSDGPGDREREPDLGGGEADDAGEVQGRSHVVRAVAERVGQLGGGEHAWRSGRRQDVTRHKAPSVGGRWAVSR